MSEQKKKWWKQISETFGQQEFIAEQLLPSAILTRVKEFPVYDLSSTTSLKA